MQETYTVKEVADLLGYSTNSIYTFLKEKQIKSVRIGKGRFRIPQKEVHRLLALSRNTVEPVPAAGVNPGTQQILVQTQLPPAPPTRQEQIEVPDSTPWHPHATTDEIPNLFEWFIATTSILLGASILLFNRYTEEFSFSQYLWVFPVLRIWLTAAGIGLLLCMAANLTRTVWYRIFYFLLCAAYAVLSGIFLLQGQWDAVVLYGAAAIIMIISHPLHFRGVFSFMLYLFLFLVLFPVPFFLGLTAKSVSLTPGIFTGQPLLFAGIWIAIAVTFTIITIRTWVKKPFISYVCLLVGTVFLMGISLWYAQNVFWSRSIVIIVIGFCTCFIPQWNSFRFRYFQERTTIFSTFGGMVGLLLFAIGVIALVSSNQVRQTEEHLENTVGYGSVLIETAIDTMQSSLEHAAQNPQTYEAIHAQDPSTIEEGIRGIFDGSRYAGSILLVDANGTIIATYPHTDLREKNLAFRDYFLQVKEHGQSVVSTDQGEIIVSVPIHAPDGTFAGAFVERFNTEYLNLRLQQLAQSSMEEYVLVTDSSGKLLLSPFTSDIAGSYGNQEPLHMTEYSPSGKRVMTARKSVDRFGWTIYASQPITSALRVSNTSSFVLFFIVCTFLIALCGIGIWKSKEKPKIRDS